MNPKYSFNSILICFVLLLTNGLIAQDASTLLNKGIYEEEINGDLDKAISIYFRIKKEFPSARSIVAESLWRLGMCSEKLGNKNAREFYFQILNEYRDQTTFVSLANERLKAFKETEQASKLPKDITAKKSDGLLKTSKVYFPGFAIRTISPNGKYLSYAATHGNLAIYDRVNDELKKLTPDPIAKDKGRELGAKGICTKTIWSPDSKKIAYIWVREDEGEDLRLFDLETQKHMTLCSFNESSVPVPMEWSKDGKSLLGVVWNKTINSQKIVFVNPKDGSIKIIKELPKNENRRTTVRASLSHDGQYIIYEDINENSKRSLFILGVNGKIDRHLFGDLSSNEMSPLWLKDDKSFLFFSDRSKSSALWKAYLNDSMEIEKTDLLVEGLGIIYHHVGVTNDDTYYYWSHIRILNLYTNSIDFKRDQLSNEQLIESANLQQRMTPIWSPNGKKITYLRLYEHTPSNVLIQVRDFETGLESDLEFALNQDSKITYQGTSLSKDEKRILFCIRNSGIKKGVSYFGGNVFEIVEGNISSGKTSVLIHNGKVPQYGPNESIIFIRDTELLQKNLSTETEEILYSNKDYYINNYSLSPDNSKIALLVGPKENGRRISDVVILSLEDNKSDFIWKCDDNKRFGHNIRWLNDSESILVDVFPIGAQSQQIFIYNVKTSIKRKIGSPIEGAENVYYRIDINQLTNQLVYQKRQNSISLWSLENY